MQCGRAAWVLGLTFATALACAGQPPLGATVEAGASVPDAALPADLPPPADAAPPADVAPGIDRPPPPISACATPLPAPLRRLNNAQYLRTVHELTGLSLTSELPREYNSLWVDGFRTDRSVGPDVVLAWDRAADEIAAGLMTRQAELTACPGGTLDDACARAFILRFGRRVHRRPLEEAEVAAYAKLFSGVRELGDASDGLGAVLRAMFQSPSFVYRVEVSGRPAATSLVPDPYEVATRLSYFLWGNMPDDELFAAADANLLATQAQVTAQAQRMLRDPRARQGTNDFFRLWLDLDDVLDRPKDPARVPDWETALRPALREEGYRFTQKVVFDGDGKFASLFTSTETVVNERLAQLYGLQTTGTGWQPVSLVGKPRLGMLTQGWFLAGRASDTDSNPSKRGSFIRTRLFCQDVPPPPPSVDPTLPPTPTPATTRERFQVHLANPACVACHNLMDPLGFPFEAYDGLGTFRTQENGKPVDTSGRILDTDTDGPVTDALELSRRLAASDQARNCLGRRWYELAVGRRSDEVDTCRLSELKRRLEASRGDLQQLMVDIVTVSALAPRPGAEVIPRPIGQPLLSNPRVAKKMVLDLLATQLGQLKQRLPQPDDRQVLEQHLEGLRQLELRLP